MIPCIYVSIISFHISRIDGYFENYDEIKKEKYFHFSLGKYDNDYLRYFFAILFYFFSNYFLYVLNEFKTNLISAPIPSFEESNIIKNENENEIQKKIYLMKKK